MLFFTLKSPRLIPHFIYYSWISRIPEMFSSSWSLVVLPFYRCPILDYYSSCVLQLLLCCPDAAAHTGHCVPSFIAHSIANKRLLIIADCKVWSKGDTLFDTVLKGKQVVDITVHIRNFSLRDSVSLSHLPYLHGEFLLQLFSLILITKSQNPIFQHSRLS